MKKKEEEKLQFLRGLEVRLAAADLSTAVGPESAVVEGTDVVIGEMSDEARRLWVLVREVEVKSKTFAESLPDDPPDEDMEKISNQATALKEEGDLLDVLMWGAIRYRYPATQGFDIAIRTDWQVVLSEQVQLHPDLVEFVKTRVNNESFLSMIIQAVEEVDLSTLPTMNDPVQEGETVIGTIDSEEVKRLYAVQALWRLKVRAFPSFGFKRDVVIKLFWQAAQASFAEKLVETPRTGLTIKEGWQLVAFNRPELRHTTMVIMIG